MSLYYKRTAQKVVHTKYSVDLPRISIFLHDCANQSVPHDSYNDEYGEYCCYGNSWWVGHDRWNLILFGWNLDNKKTIIPKIMITILSLTTCDLLTCCISHFDERCFISDHEWQQILQSMKTAQKPCSKSGRFFIQSNYYKVFNTHWFRERRERRTFRGNKENMSLFWESGTS